MELVSLIERSLQGMEFDLVDVERPKSQKLLRIYIDKVNGSVTIDDCVAVSNHLTRLLEVENFEYERLEVSSPGIDRILSSRRDFERFQGAMVIIKLKEPVNGRRKVKGVLVGLVEDKIKILADGNDVILSMDTIDNARLSPENHAEK